MSKLKQLKKELASLQEMKSFMLQALNSNSGIALKYGKESVKKEINNIQRLIDNNNKLLNYCSKEI